MKRFVAQRIYADGSILSLFRDRDWHCLLVAWNDARCGEVGLPLPGVGAVRATRLDGTASAFDASAGALTLGLSDEPCLLEFTAATFEPPETLAAPQATIADGIPAVVKGERRATTSSAAASATASWPGSAAPTPSS